MDSDESQKLEKAESFKATGNTCFNGCDYTGALENYTKAIELKVSDIKKAAVYYANRAFAQIKLENYGFALEDASEAIKSDPNYAKGYYRKGSALFALGKYKNSLAMFKRVLEMVPNDQDAKEKYSVI